MEAISEARPTDTGAVSWAAQALTLTAGVGIVAKIFGVLLLPGSRGVLSQRTVEIVDTTSATFAYVLAALLVALVCASSFELARARHVGVGARATVIASSGLVVALASPAVVTRLHTLGSLALAVATSVLAIVAGIVALRARHTRAVGGVLVVLSFCALARVVGWELAALGADRPATSLLEIGRGLATLAVVVHSLAVLVAAAWVSTRSRVLGRVLANASILLGLLITYLAARVPEGAPSTVESILRGSLAEAAGVPTPYAVTAVGAFLVPASILLAIAALVSRIASGGQNAVVVATLALALLSHGSFDVPLQALAAAAAAHWTMLAMFDDRAAWKARLRKAPSPE